MKKKYDDMSDKLEYDNITYNDLLKCLGTYKDSKFGVVEVDQYL